MASTVPSQKLRRLCLALAAAIVFQLFYLGAQPLAAGLIPEPWDKLAHLVVYGTVTVLLQIGAGDRMPPAALIATVAVVGILDEWHQAGLPGRTADISDLLVDVCAAIIATILFRLGAKHYIELNKTVHRGIHFISSNAARITSCRNRS